MMDMLIGAALGVLIGFLVEAYTAMKREKEIIDILSKEKFELHPNEIALFLLRIFVLYLHWQVLHDQLLLNLPRAGRQQG